MDTIIYLYTKSKKQGNTIGGLAEGPPVFFFQCEKKMEYHLLYVGIPEEMLLTKEQDLVPKKGRTGKEKGARTRSKHTKEVGFRKSHPNKNKADWIRELYGYLRVYQLQSPACYTVCDRSVEKWLKKEHLYEWWQESWPISSFVNYRETYFARELMEQAKLSHYIILGYDPYLPELLKAHVRYMKTLRFVLTSAPEEELDDFLENCYDEYGLTASVEQVEPRRGHEDTPFYGYQVKSAVPSMIIDYSNEIRLFTADLARGSLWLDMDALEEKRYRMEERNTGIQYISMKKKWKNSAYT